MSCRLPEKTFSPGCKHVANEKPIFQFLECHILNENLKFCMISVQEFSVLWIFFSGFSIFMHEGHVLPLSGNICLCKEQELIFL